MQPHDILPATVQVTHDHQPGLDYPHDILLNPLQPNDPLQDPAQTLNLQPAPVQPHVVQLVDTVISKMYFRKSIKNSNANTKVTNIVCEFSFT